MLCMVLLFGIGGSVRAAQTGEEGSQTSEDLPEGASGSLQEELPEEEKDQIDSAQEDSSEDEQTESSEDQESDEEND